MNRVIEEALRHYVSADLKDWDIYLPSIEFAINNQHSEATGMSPFQVIYGFNPSDLFDRKLGLRPELMEPGPVIKGQARTWTVRQKHEDMTRRVQLATRNLLKAQQIMKQAYDKGKADLTFKKGDMVLLSTKNLDLVLEGAKKLGPRFIGPFKVTKVVNRNAYELDMPGRYKVHNVFHVSLLKPYPTNVRGTPPPEPVLVEGEEEWLVEAIVKHRVVQPKRKDKNGKRHNKGQPYLEFFTKFVNVGSHENRWLKETDFTCDGQYDNPILKEYLARLQNAPPSAGRVNENATKRRTK